METFVYLCSSLAALGHLNASFHCARLHKLCTVVRLLIEKVYDRKE